MIGIVDYGVGNLASVAGAVRRLEREPVVTADPKVLARCDRLILPGVGAFGLGMKQLRDRGLDEALTDLAIGRGRPILGVCLGFQLMAKDSEEFGLHAGLGWIDASVRRIAPQSAALRVPHVGWNDVRAVRPSRLFDGIAEDSLFYFVHSYRLIPVDVGIVTGETDYGGPIVASYERDNIYATQFHPEKSQLAGLAVLRNFIEKA